VTNRGPADKHSLRGVAVWRGESFRCVWISILNGFPYHLQARLPLGAKRPRTFEPGNSRFCVERHLSWVCETASRRPKVGKTFTGGSGISLAWGQSRSSSRGEARLRCDCFNTTRRSLGSSIAWWSWDRSESFEGQLSRVVPAKLLGDGRAENTGILGRQWIASG